MVLLALAPARVFRILREPDFWRVYPLYAAALRRLLIAEALGLAALAVLEPALGLVAVLALPRERALAPLAQAAGLRHPGGLPPGSLDLLAPTTLFDSRYYLTATQAHGPLFKCSALARSQVCVASLGSGADPPGVRRPSPPPAGLPFHRFVPGGFLRRMEEPAHETYRRLFSSVLPRALVRARRPVLRAAAARGVRHRGGVGGRGSHGCRPAARRAARARGLVPRLPGRRGGARGRGPPGRALRRDRHPDRHPSPAEMPRSGTSRPGWGAPGPGPPAPATAQRALGVLGEVLDRKPDALRDATTVRNLIYMVSTSADVSGLRVLLKLLSDHPGWADRLRRDGRPPGGTPGRVPPSPPASCPRRSGSSRASS